ncbi:MAG TPA: sugar ABC transporter ATP-binding protein [Fimbriimonadaceae bacterium]|nr:sugar ABC transporter ATP-binding protein [Fimbriimonadaceae bacterium]
MSGIGKSFPGVRALEDVSLEVLAGEVHALMGENGAGKSTLMKILAGAYAVDEGIITLDGEEVRIEGPRDAAELGISIIYQELNLVSQLSVAENIFLGREPRRGLWIDDKRMRAEATALVQGLGLDIDVTTQVGDLPVAKQQIVEIAKATSVKSRIIVMDEPSATLTENELENLYRLIRQLKAQGVAVVYISHRMDEVFSICDRVTVLRDGRTVGTHRMSEVSPDGLIKMMVGRTLDENFPKVSVEPGEPVLEVDGLCRAGVLKDISFTVRAGEVVALAGLVGSGRTEIARCIFGADSYDAGKVRVIGKELPAHRPTSAIAAGVGLVPEDRKGQGLVLGLGVRENATLAALGSLSRIGFVDAKRDRHAAEEYREKLGVRTPSIEQAVRNLSGGNQQKVVLAKWLLTNSKLLLLDEPTRGIDVGAKVEIYRLMNLLTSQGIGILMISSELPEVLGMADRVLVMREGRVVGELSRAEATQERIGELAVGVPVRES